MDNIKLAKIIGVIGIIIAIILLSYAMNYLACVLTIKDFTDCSIYASNITDTEQVCETCKNIFNKQ